MESGLSSLPDDEEVLHSSVSVDFGESLDFQQHPAERGGLPLSAGVMSEEAFTTTQCY